MEENNPIKKLTVGSLFSGIGGFDLGFESVGMKTVWQVEIDSKCLEVLEKHFPDVKRYKDVKEVGKHNLETVDIICGGFPCQDLSVAGRREGLKGERSGLWYEFERIIGELKPEWVIVENVHGLLSSAKGRDFAIILQGLEKFGYGVAWRTLDAQFFGVPQRRRRVFIVGHLGDRSASEVLFNEKGSQTHNRSGRETPEKITGNASECAVGNIEFLGIGNSGGRTLKFNKKINTLTAQTGSETTAMFNGVFWHNKQQSGEIRILGSVSPTMATTRGTGGNNVPFVGVRKLTPTECARLQGFPDDWNVEFADSVRYKQFGNAVAVPVVEWLGKRIIEYNKE